jgi:hypothetical protein
MTGLALGLALAASGCNQIYGNDSAKLVDARYFDVAPDTPFACPSIGTLAPRFLNVAEQALLQDCFDFAYSETAGRGLAICRDDLGRTFLGEGPIDGPMTPAAGIDQAPMLFLNVRLGADGDVAVIFSEDRQPFAQHIATWRRDASGWTKRADFAPVSQYQGFSTPSAGPNPHMVAFTATTTSATLHELELDGADMWREVSTTSSTQLQVSGVPGSGTSLTPDGLRLVFSAVTSSGSGLAYSDRESLTGTFGPATLLPVPSSSDPFMLPDCSRLYFSAVGNVFYVRQP